MLKNGNQNIYIFSLQPVYQNSKSTDKNHLKENECLFQIDDIILQMGSYNEAIWENIYFNFTHY
jgi:hypothetical protein